MFLIPVNSIMIHASPAEVNLERESHRYSVELATNMISVNIELYCLSRHILFTQDLKNVVGVNSYF